MKGTDSGIPVVDSSKADPAKVKEAEAACDDRRSVPPATAEKLAKANQITACMRTNGFPKFPDPDPKTGEHDMEGFGLKQLPGGMEALKKCDGGGKSLNMGDGAAG